MSSAARRSTDDRAQAQALAESSSWRGRIPRKLSAVSSVLMLLIALVGIPFLILETAVPELSWARHSRPRSARQETMSSPLAPEA
ncbi:hypothetical protein GCM10010156_65370 [Planobispora rosea]|uniref:Uncharacterized protein n=1 Tax=Planobispora rosea TaxID=35762 RepID=A0A8J3SA60_PLARO|nr:hypothetical protein GCM10010156_65370 [Planobispora rosea]GIH87924.1 hypothetical protein Pro02_63320 [Planobispora rosea]